MSNVPELARLAIEEARKGDLAKAVVLAEQALAHHAGDPGLILFVASLHARQMDLKKAALHLRNAAKIVPNDPVVRLELVRVLIGLDQPDEAESLLGGIPPGLESNRLRALLHMRRGDYRNACALYEQILAAEPRDFESWGNLGVARLRNGEASRAVDALTTSIKLRPDQQRFQEQWAEAHLAAGTGEDGLKFALALAEQAPANASIRITVARLEDLLGRPERAVAVLEDLLRREPRNVAALLALARLHERQNRVEDFAEAIDRLGPIPEAPLLKAQLLFRRGQFDEALELAQSAPANVDPGTRAELIGRINDRLGKSDEAFAAFAEMNRNTALAPDVAERRATNFRERLEAKNALLSKSWVESWKGSQPPDIAQPAFVLSFPRSGTTLLDTLLMGHSGICVAEEKPMLDRVAARVGTDEKLAGLGDDRLDELRRLYLDIAERSVPDRDGRLLVDKQPFATVEVPLIHRLFPAARLVFVERHPCDVVLSCFFTRFEPNPGLLNFTTLESAARLYDRVMTCWFKCRELLPLSVHALRYERLVVDAETEMRSLLAFLGLDWQDGILDHASTAAKRRFISTPSYSQVVEPLYDRSIGRWQRYARQMEPVLPILEPWVKRMGYEI